ncbi:hypothetical protein L2004_07710 [Lactobacillus mulieris]|uniref:hypothetical protein n=1 Tax=Lactobacillus mulieris TaxID=2508708 RepID=UPI0022CD982E|nr:hypothetical protein [Lactobacillus mulieris]MCZ9648410.1 hypothetical protein [Lactobacillus mulieris]
MMLLLLIIILFFCYYFLKLLIIEDKDLIRALKRWIHDPSYAEKMANIAIIGSKIDYLNKNVIITINTKTFWQLHTDTLVRAEIKKRVNSDEFSDFLKLKFGEKYVFSTQKIYDNYVQIIGTSVI